MSENFAELFAESLQFVEMNPGAIIPGTVVDIDKDWVTIHVGLKSEDKIPLAQFVGEQGEFTLKIGDQVKVALKAVDDGFGSTRLSRDDARRAEVWMLLEDAFENSRDVQGYIQGKVKGGFTVDMDGIRAFLPGSLVDLRPVRDVAHLEGKELEFRVIKLDQRRNNVVVSRRAVLEQENSAEREALLATLEEGMDLTGVVKNLTDYGAFVDLGGVDGLLHITDMAWRRIKHPSKVVSVGDEIRVRVLKFERDRQRVSLGLKQLGEDPWVDIVARYPKNAIVPGRVTNLAEYGCFVEIEEGVEGLVHVSELDWTNKNIHPGKVVQIGDEVDVMILDIDEERRRISLGIKQTQQNPWEHFAAHFAKGDKISGAIKSITDFGIFIGLDGGIDGLVHLSDISWSEPSEQAVRNFSKGDEVAAVVLSVDPERERISLGIKQLEDDPFNDWVADNNRGVIVKGTVASVEAREAIIALTPDVEGVLKASDISVDRVEDARTVLNEGDEIEVKVIAIDSTHRFIGLSIKAKDLADEREAVREHREREQESTSSVTTIGDLIRKEMDQQKS